MVQQYHPPRWATLAPGSGGDSIKEFSSGILQLGGMVGFGLHYFYEVLNSEFRTSRVINGERNVLGFVGVDTMNAWYVNSHSDDSEAVNGDK